MSISKRSETILRPEERSTLEQLLDHLDQPQTRGLVHALLAEQPALIEIVDRYVSGIAESTPAKQPQKQPAKSSSHSAVDPSALSTRSSSDFTQCRGTLGVWMGR